LYLHSSIFCGKGEKWPISVAGSVCGMSYIWGPHFAEDWNCLPVQATHTIFRRASSFIDHAITEKIMHAGIHVTTRLFYENNISWKKRFGFILIVMHGSYNMNLKSNQKLMFCKDRGIVFNINNNYYILK